MPSRNQRARRRREREAQRERENRGIREAALAREIREAALAHEREEAEKALAREREEAEKALARVKIEEENKKWPFQVVNLVNAPCTNSKSNLSVESGGLKQVLKTILDSGECPVCLEMMEQPMITICGHSFCSTCCFHFSSEASPCPVCRFPEAAVRAVPNYALSTLLQQISEISENYSGVNESTFEASAPPLPVLELSSDTTQRRPTIRTICLRRIRFRVFIVDNSPSTLKVDATLYKDATGTGNLKGTACSRWDEIKGRALSQAEIALECNIVTVFLLTHPPSGFDNWYAWTPGVDFFYLGGGTGDPRQFSECEAFFQANAPGGVSYGSARNSYEKSYEVAMHLLAAYKKRKGEDLSEAPVCVLTGGCESSSRTWSSICKHKTGHDRISLTFCLATSDKAVSNSFETSFPELTTDIVSDIRTEAKQAKHHGNDWFVYTREMHYLRGAGGTNYVLSLLDRRQLSRAEIGILAALLLDVWDDPVERERWNESSENLVEYVKRTPSARRPVFCVRRNEFRPLIDPERLEERLLQASGQVTTRGLKVRRLKNRISNLF